MKIIGEIPARYGSKRVPNKNIKPIAGKPLIQYVIESSLQSDLLSDVYVNTESDVIGNLAIHNNVKYYKRKKELAEDDIVSDQFNYDFIKNIKPDVLVMINPVSPLITGQDIDDVINFYTENKYDTVVTIKEEHLQSFYQNKPINFDINRLLPQTQNIKPIQICSWSVCVWNCTKFIEQYEKNGYAVFVGECGFYPLSPLKSVKISTLDDFKLCESILLSQK